MTAHRECQPDSAPAPLSVRYVLQEAREGQRWHASNNAPYTAGMLGDCIEAIEQLQQQIAALSAPKASVEPADGAREALGNLPLQYVDGPDYCTVTDATGGAFALTVQPELMKLMEAAALQRSGVQSRDDARRELSVLLARHDHRYGMGGKDESAYAYAMAHKFEKRADEILALIDAPSVSSAEPLPTDRYAVDDPWQRPAHSPGEAGK
jgi:hypothetical protein